MADQLTVTITVAQEISPGLTVVRYRAETGSTWRKLGPGDGLDSPGVLVRSAGGQALVGTTGAALLPFSERAPGFAEFEFCAAIFAAEQERRKVVQQ